MVFPYSKAELSGMPPRLTRQCRKPDCPLPWRLSLRTVGLSSYVNRKEASETFGHPVGDKLLHLVAKTIKNNIRAIDVIVRFGGDEFGILLAETGAESAAQVVGKLKKKLLELMRYNGWPVTFSIGVSTFINPPDKIDEMIDAADVQMYFAKQNGKNRTWHKVFGKENRAFRPLGKAS